MKYIKRPIPVDAVRWFPDPEFGEFKNGKYINHKIGYDSQGVEYTVCDVGIRTLNGFAHLEAGEWIITGVKGDVYPCTPPIFASVYVEEDLFEVMLEGAIRTALISRHTMRGHAPANWKVKICSCGLEFLGVLAHDRHEREELIKAVLAAVKGKVEADEQVAVQS